jgi:hypothetical protein
MTEMTMRVEAALAEVIAEHGDKALASAFGLFLADHKDKLGRAAIEAMREPTEAMINSPMARCYNDGPYADKEVRRIFSAMIDAALAHPQCP